MLKTKKQTFQVQMFIELTLLKKGLYLNKNINRNCGTLLFILS